MVDNQHVQAEDEIDLIEVWHTIVRGKTIIIACVLFSIFIALGYLWLTKNEYKSTAYLLPPTIKNISELNRIKFLKEDNVEITTEKVYGQLISYLHSRTLKQKIFNQEKIVELLDTKDTSLHKIFEEQFVKKVKVKVIGNKKSIDILSASAVEVSIQLPALAKRVANITNKYIKVALEDTKRLVVDDLKANINNEIKSLKVKIKNTIEQADLLKNDKIENLQAALDIAQALGLKSPIASASYANRDAPMFYQGAKALKKEISILKNRKDNAPFIEGLRNLENKLSYYQSIVTDESLINVAKVDSWAFPSVDVETPKKRLILFLFVIVGSFLGIFLVFLRSMIKKSGKQE